MTAQELLHQINEKCFALAEKDIYLSVSVDHKAGCISVYQNVNGSCSLMSEPIFFGPEFMHDYVNTDGIELLSELDELLKIQH